MALSQSLPTAKTQEFGWVVTIDALGAATPLAPPTAPMAPAPPMPAGLAPVNETIVMEAAVLRDSVPVTVPLVMIAGANARQISELPAWVLVRRTNVQVSPLPVTPVTVVAEFCAPSEEMNASSNSLVAWVVKTGDTIVVELFERSVKVVTSTARPVPPVPVDVKLIPERLAPLTVTFWLTGVKLNPALLGVTVYEPFAKPVKLYTPEALAVTVAVDVPVSVMVAALPPAPLMVPPILKVCNAELKFAVWLAPLSVTFCAAGVKTNPALLGVTVYAPFARPVKL